jgi:mono/diheme cytochrome c family protein
VSGKLTASKQEIVMNKPIFICTILLLFIALAAGCGGSSEDSGADVAAGQALFNQAVIGSNAGCMTCHSLDEGVVIVGPSLAEWGHEAEVEGGDFGMTAEEFTRQSILDPNAVLATDFPADTMPKNWGEELSDEQLNNLVAFLLSLE